MPNSKPGVRSGRKLLSATAVAGLAFLLQAGPALAHRAPTHPPPRPDVVSSVNQYVELIPTGRGAKPISSVPTRGTVSPAVQARLRTLPTPLAKAVKRTVVLGQPAHLRPVRHQGSVRAAGIVPPSGSNFGAFLGILAAISVVAVGGAVLRRRS